VLVVGRLQRGRHGGGGGAGRGSGFWGGLGFHGRCRGQRGGEGRSKDRGRGVVASWRWEMMARWEKGRKTATEAGCVRQCENAMPCFFFFGWGTRKTLGVRGGVNGAGMREMGGTVEGWKPGLAWVGIGGYRILFGSRYPSCN
jgi:hypothetical protein